MTKWLTKAERDSLREQVASVAAQALAAEMLRPLDTLDEAVRLLRWDHERTYCGSCPDRSCARCVERAAFLRAVDGGGTP